MKEVEVVIEKEVPVEVEKIVEVERKVEVPKEVVVTREVEVPGPERIVEVPGPERVVEKIVEVPGPERIIEKTVRVENPARINQVQMQLSAIQKERDALQRQVNELLNPPKAQPEESEKPKVPNSWTFVPPKSDLPVDNDDKNDSTKYYIKKP